MGEKYSAEWIKAQADAMNAAWLDHHDCSICRQMVGYVLFNDDVYFRSSCGCSWSPDRQSSYEDIANWLAMQSTDEIRDRIMTGLHADANA